jgi:hypothetical protein
MPNSKAGGPPLVGSPSAFSLHPDLYSPHLDVIFCPQLAHEPCHDDKKATQYGILN